MHASSILRLLTITQAAAICVVLMGCRTDETPVPTLAQETARLVSFTTSDSVDIVGRLFGQGRTGVVLAHMFPADQSSWWEFAQVLAELGYTALTFDFRGYGDSGGGKEIKLIGRDVEAAVEFLKEQGISNVFLIGASMGGTAALNVAAGQIQGIAGVVSLSAPVEFKGISLRGEQIKVPTLLMAAQGDASARKNLNSLIDDGIVVGAMETVVYEKSNDHGTNILNGENADTAEEKILSFLEANVP